MKVDKVVTVQVKDISIVEVDVILLKNIPHQLLFICFFGGLVDAQLTLGPQAVWNMAQKKPCLT